MGSDECRVPELQIVYYGTGLALSTTVLDDGTIVELRRDPSMQWWASVKRMRFKELDEVVSLYDNLVLSPTSIRLPGESPQHALKSITVLMNTSRKKGWLL